MNVIYTYILFIYLFIYLLNKYIELNSVRKGAALRNSAKFTGKHLCQRLFFNRPEACNFIKKRQEFSGQFCEISKDIFSYRTLLGDCF